MPPAQSVRAAMFAVAEHLGHARLLHRRLLRWRRGLHVLVRVLPLEQALEPLFRLLPQRLVRHQMAEQGGRVSTANLRYAHQPRREVCIVSRGS